MFGNTILDSIFAPWAMNALFTANRLKIFSMLAEKEMTAEEITSLSGAIPRFLIGLLDACVAMGWLRLKDNRYMNTHLSETYLVEGKPLYLGDIIEVQSVEASSWEGLYELVVSGRSASKDGSKRKVTPHRFTMAMNNLAMLGEAEALASAIDLSGRKELVDVGCGSGVYSIALCRCYPNLRATLLDTKDVLKTTSQFIRKSKLHNRIRMRASDITRDSCGKNMDVALLSDVLYQERSSCMTIIRSAYSALAPEGILIVRGYYSDPEGSQPVFGSLFALGRLLYDADREIISVPLLRHWVEESDFKNLRAFALTERSTCLIAEKGNMSLQ